MIETLFNHNWIVVACELGCGLSFCAFVVAGVVALANPVAVRTRRRMR